jgi:hypothetical protein
MPLFFVLMRLRGFHVQDGRPFFLTTAHSDSDLAAFSEAFKMSVCELIVADLLSGDKLAANRTMRANDAVPPVPGARLGRDDDGNPAWYVEDASRPGEYTQVGLVQSFH